jgi:hypothetical protein
MGIIPLRRTIASAQEGDNLRGFSEGGYVVRNDRTGDIVQVSDRTDLGWRAPWDL